MCVGGALVTSPQEAEDGRRHGQARSWLKGIRSWEGGQRPSLNLTLGPQPGCPPPHRATAIALGLGAHVPSKGEGVKGSRMREAVRQDPLKPCRQGPEPPTCHPTERSR